MALNFGNKVEDGGTSPQGRLTAKEFNDMVSLVNSNEHLIAELTKVAWPLRIVQYTSDLVFEAGQSVDILLSWQYNKDVESQNINGEALTIEDRQIEFNGIAEDVSYVLSANVGNEVVMQTANVSFQRKIYFGALTSAQAQDAEILSMTNIWASQIFSPIKIDCSGGKYIYCALPKSMAGDVDFWISGLRVSSWNQEERGLTNSFGHTEQYVIFRLSNKLNSTITFEIK